MIISFNRFGEMLKATTNRVVLGIAEIVALVKKVASSCFSLIKVLFQKVDYFLDKITPNPSRWEEGERIKKNTKELKRASAELEIFTNTAKKLNSRGEKWNEEAVHFLIEAESILEEKENSGEKNLAALKARAMDLLQKLEKWKKEVSDTVSSEVFKKHKELLAEIQKLT